MQTGSRRMKRGKSTRVEQRVTERTSNAVIIFITEVIERKKRAQENS